MIDINALGAPFSPTVIHWRIGSQTKDKTSGMPLAYVDARDVMERLDSVCGSLGWQDRYPFTGCCEIGIRDTVINEWVWKSNGAGETKIEAEKGQFSDAFKRAGVMWNIARYLYDLPNIWVSLDNGRLSNEVQSDLTIRLAKWQTSYFGGK